MIEFYRNVEIIFEVAGATARSWRRGNNRLMQGDPFSPILAVSLTNIQQNIVTRVCPTVSTYSYIDDRACWATSPGSAGRIHIAVGTLHIIDGCFGWCIQRSKTEVAANSNKARTLASKEFGTAATRTNATLELLHDVENADLLRVKKDYMNEAIRRLGRVHIASRSMAERNSLISSMCFSLVMWAAELVPQKSGEIRRLRAGVHAAFLSYCPASASFSAECAALPAKLDPGIRWDLRTFRSMARDFRSPTIWAWQNHLEEDFVQGTPWDRNPAAREVLRRFDFVVDSTDGSVLRFCDSAQRMHTWRMKYDGENVWTIFLIEHRNETNLQREKRISMPRTRCDEGVACGLRLAERGDHGWADFTVHSLEIHNPLAEHVRRMAQRHLAVSAGPSTWKVYAKKSVQVSRPSCMCGLEKPGQKTDVRSASSSRRAMRPPARSLLIQDNPSRHT